MRKGLNLAILGFPRALNKILYDIDDGGGHPQNAKKSQMFHPEY